MTQWGTCKGSIKDYNSAIIIELSLTLRSKIILKIYKVIHLERIL